jgi:hypothetical protein
MITMPISVDHESTWLEKTISSFLSYEEEPDDSETPQEMIGAAASRAFKISTALGVVPGPVGMAVILPEVIAITRIQVNLIRRIARHYKKNEKISPEIVLLIFGNVLGVTVGETLARKVGTALVIRSVNSRLSRRIARKIGTRMIDMAAEKAIGRWIPMLTAPLFGYFSRSMTLKIGREANELLRLDFETERVETVAS